MKCEGPPTLESVRFKAVAAAPAVVVPAVALGLLAEPPDKKVPLA